MTKLRDTAGMQLRFANPIIENSWEILACNLSYLTNYEDNFNEDTMVKGNIQLASLKCSSSHGSTSEAVPDTVE